MMFCPCVVKPARVYPGRYFEEMLIQAGIPTCPEPQQERSGPREDKVAVMYGDAFVNIASATLGVLPA